MTHVSPAVDSSQSCPQDELVEFAAHALRETDADALLGHAAELASRGLRVEHVEILELLPASGSFAVRARAGSALRASARELLPGGGESQAGFTVLGPEPVVVPSLPEETRFQDARLLERGHVSSLSVVLGGNGSKPFGVLLAATATSRAFGPDEVRCLELLADVLAGALHRFGLEDALRAAEARYRTLVESLPLVTYVDELDASSSSIYASPQVEGLSGYSSDEWAADPDLFVKLLHPDDRERVLAEHVALRYPGDRLSTEYRLVARDGAIVWVSDQAVVVRDGPGGNAYLQGAMLDITGRKRLDEQLAQKAKLEVVGRLAGGIAHDFNNLLTGILGYAQFVLDNLDDGDPLRAELEEIAGAGTRAARLTKQLLVFSRQRAVDPRVVQLNEIVSDLGGLLDRVIGEDVQLELALEPALGRVHADPGQLEQLLMNLAVNARDAMPEGGALVLETRNVELRADDSHLDLADAAPGHYVVLAVRDSGVGMDAATLERVFDPFFTTKAEGTGLGLATVYGVVNESGGFVRVDSEPAVGTEFRVYLPRVDDPVVHAVGLVSSDAGGGETILVLEDEELVRGLVARGLRGLGYTVLAAADRQEADELARDGRRVDLLLADVATTGRDASSLVAELVRQNPSLRVLYMSGYEIVEAPSALMIEKPFDLRDLADRIRRVLDEPS